MTEILHTSLQQDPVPERGDHIKGRGRVRTVGLDPEVFADIYSRASQTHSDGALDFERQERAYQGGPSAADRADRMDL